MKSNVHQVFPGCQNRSGSRRGELSCTVSIRRAVRSFEAHPTQTGSPASVPQSIGRAQRTPQLLFGRSWHPGRPELHPPARSCRTAAISALSSRDFWQVAVCSCVNRPAGRAAMSGRSSRCASNVGNRRLPPQSFARRAESADVTTSPGTGICNGCAGRSGRGSKGGKPTSRNATRLRSGIRGPAPLDL